MVIKTRAIKAAVRVIVIAGLLRLLETAEWVGSLIVVIPSYLLLADRVTIG